VNTLSPIPTADNGNLAERIVAFSHYLRDRGFRVYASNVLGALQGLQAIDIAERRDFFSTLRTHFVSNDTEWALFGEYFDSFWNGIPAKGVQEGEQEPQLPPDLTEMPAGEVIPDTNPPGTETLEELPEKEILEGATYSPIPSLEKRDIATFSKRDIRVAQLLMKYLISLFKVSTGRRTRRSRKPENIDFRRVTAKSLKTGGIPFKLYYRKKRKRPKKVVVLADVSGSMERYAHFVIPFVLGLRGVGSKAEVFLFSTSLSCVSPYMKKFGLDRVLEIMSREVPDWSGGTRIGHSLRQFNEEHGDRLLNRRTVIVILSDGWDLGGRQILVSEMANLKRRANCILWLNPLPIHSASYVPAKGMRAALPFVDYFLPADSLESLRKVGRTLSNILAEK